MILLGNFGILNGCRKKEKKKVSKHVEMEGRKEREIRSISREGKEVEQEGKKRKENNMKKRNAEKQSNEKTDPRISN